MLHNSQYCLTNLIFINFKGHLKTSWRALVEFVLSQFGGRASLDAIYKAVEPIRHTTNVWWKEKVRQQLQTGPFFKDGDEWVFEMQKAA